MVSKSALVAVVLVAVTNAVPIANPLQMMARAGPEAGKVLSPQKRELKNID